MNFNHTKYEKALNKSYFWQDKATGLLGVDGEDQLSFLQRQSTNDVAKLGEGQVISTVLTSPTARILDVLTLYFSSPAKNRLNLLTLAGHGEHTLRYLKSRIFFNDKVSITNLSHDNSRLILGGPDAARKLVDIGFSNLPGSGNLTTGELDGVSVSLFENQTQLGLGYTLITSNEGSSIVKMRLEESNFVQLTNEEFEILRIEMGIPGSESELTDDYTPLEINLDALISDKKGCYTGQEIIARQITYDKVVRKLVGIQFDGKASPGSPLSVEDKPAGKITSIGFSPSLGHIGLAVVRKAYTTPGTLVDLYQEENKIKGVVVNIPFAK